MLSDFAIEGRDDLAEKRNKRKMMPFPNKYPRVQPSEVKGLGVADATPYDFGTVVLLLIQRRHLTPVP